MVAPNALVVSEAIAVMAADLFAFGIVLRAYLRHRRRSALMFSLAWFFDFLAIALSSSEGTLQAFGILSFPAFSALLFAGAIYMLQEEGIAINRKALLSTSPAPLIFMLYLLGVYAYTGDPEWTATAAASLGITGMFVTMAGILLRGLVEIYHSAARYFYIGVILFGFHLVPAALFGKSAWYEPIGFSLSAVLIITMVAAILKMVHSETFIKGVPEGKIGKVNLEPGVLIVTPEEYRNIQTKLLNFPVLAFLRDTSRISKQWKVYFVTNAPFGDKGSESIRPTDLAKIGEMIYRYVSEMKEKGLRGIVVVDCLEYLIIYNHEEGFLKFISQVRDFVVLSGGTLILVVDPESVGERLMAQLERLLA
ncbi:hypothetical protein A3L09_07215 [Thermococcus profundus]|uniref:DUF835 domain-containing protein n=1 Tax=Thermococcus profundus TaxID=49899 RepID=A0A2Z2MMB8_THEPR|nr:DUF835 domain-containing protein [Thermococcus profundus]ASJ03058.1 hypothetical protein A3L09_07215 [Thermococcus profundus]